MQYCKLKFNRVIVATLMALAWPALARNRANGNAESGHTKSSTCTACHGSNGISINENWPNLAGQKENYIVEQLYAFKKGTRANPLMTGISRMLTDEDIHDLAAYFSNLKP